MTICKTNLYENAILFFMAQVPVCKPFFMKMPFWIFFLFLKK